MVVRWCFELEWNKLADRVSAAGAGDFHASRPTVAILRLLLQNVPAADILSECKKVGVNQGSWRKLTGRVPR